MSVHFHPPELLVYLLLLLLLLFQHLLLNLLLLLHAEDVQQLLALLLEKLLLHHPVAAFYLHERGAHLFEVLFELLVVVVVLAVQMRDKLIEVTDHRFFEVAVLRLLLNVLVKPALLVYHHLEHLEILLFVAVEIRQFLIQRLQTLNLDLAFSYLRF